jgi:hypothetical protein
LTIFEINKCQLANFIYSVINKLVPSKLLNFFTLTSQVHSHEIRGRLNLQSVFAKNNTHKLSLTVRSPDFWNKIPIKIREAPTVEKFKKSFKEYLTCER